MSRISSSGGWRKWQGERGGGGRGVSPGVMAVSPLTTVQKAIHLSAHRQLDNLDLVSDDPRLAALVQGGIEHLSCIGMELVGEARPVEVEAERS